MNAISLPAEFSEVASICTATDVMIGGRSVLGIEDARALHNGLGVGRDYATWIKGRITKYGFTENVDFEVFTQSGENLQGGDAPESRSPVRGSKWGGHNAVVYRLTLDMAKELAMVENNDRGRLVRRYFIWVDEQARLSGSHPADELAERTNGISRMLARKVTGMERVLADMSARLDQFADLAGRVQPGTALVTTHATANEVAIEAGADQRGRRGLSLAIGNFLENVCHRNGESIITGRDGKRRFPRAILDGAVKKYIDALVQAHNDYAVGQERLALVGPKKAGTLARLRDQAKMLEAEIAAAGRAPDGIAMFVIGGDILIVDTRPETFAPGVEVIAARSSEIVVAKLSEQCTFAPGRPPPPRAWFYDSGLDSQFGYPTKTQINVVGRVIARKPLAQEAPSVNLSALADAAVSAIRGEGRP